MAIINTRNQYRVAWIKHNEHWSKNSVTLSQWWQSRQSCTNNFTFTKKHSATPEWLSQILCVIPGFGSFSEIRTCCQQSLSTKKFWTKKTTESVYSHKNEVLWFLCNGFDSEKLDYVVELMNFRSVELKSPVFLLFNCKGNKSRYIYYTTVATNAKEPSQTNSKGNTACISKEKKTLKLKKPTCKKRSDFLKNLSN